LYSLAVIYGREFRQLLRWFGIDLNMVAEDMEGILPPKTHLSRVCGNVSAVQLPIRFDPGFDARRTMNFGRMIEAWGLIPITDVAQLDHSRYIYAYIGFKDYTMYPILPPGSFIQVDESKNQIEEEELRSSEYERPIYFLETRDGYVACWCALKDQEIVLMPHPLSPVPPRILRYPQDAGVIGQVVGVGMRLGNFQATSEEINHVGV
jgi:hypothetical protein